MIDAVDEDCSGKIEFNEFLSIIKNSDGNEKSVKINKFFKDLTTGELGAGDLPFTVFIQKLRRDHMMDGLMSEDPKKKEFGDKIIKNVGKQLQAKRQRQKKTS